MRRRSRHGLDAGAVAGHRGGKEEEKQEDEGGARTKCSGRCSLQDIGRG